MSMNRIMVSLVNIYKEQNKNINQNKQVISRARILLHLQLNKLIKNVIFKYKYDLGSRLFRIKKKQFK